MCNFSVIVSSALMNSISKLHVPFMTLPFNFIAIISFLNFQSEEYFSHLDASISIKSNNTSTDIDWIRVVEGMVVSMGQVYAVGGLPTSIIMWVAVALYSPLLAILSALGALIGTFLPLLFLGNLVNRILVFSISYFRSRFLWFCLQWTLGLQLYFINSSSFLGLFQNFMESIFRSPLLYWRFLFFQENNFSWSHQCFIYCLCAKVIVSHYEQGTTYLRVLIQLSIIIIDMVSFRNRCICW